MDNMDQANLISQSYDILPDMDSWANAYALVRFPERPSAATAIVSQFSSFLNQHRINRAYADIVQNPAATASSPRLAKAILRPIREDEDQQMIEFYLPKEEDLTQLEEAYDKAIPPDQVDNVYAVSGEDPNDPALGDIFPVSRHFGLNDGIATANKLAACTIRPYPNV